MMLKYKDHEFILKEDFDFMLNVLKQHENYDDKIGMGSTDYKNRCFWLERMDGTKTDFSFIKCLSSANEHSDYLKACRKAVEYVVINFRDITFANNAIIYCPVLGVQITKNESHVDHYYVPFIKIAKDFFETLNQPPVILHGDGKIGVEFADKRLERNWIDYHNKYAKLRVISEKANLSLKKLNW